MVSNLAKALLFAALLLCTSLAGCLGDEAVAPDVVTAEDGSQSCWAIVQVITTMDHESEEMRNNHYTMTNMTYDAACNMVSSLTWSGDGWGSYTNSTHNDQGQPLLTETVSGTWNNTTGVLEGQYFTQFMAYEYNDGLLMQLHSYYPEGGDEYWNYTYDAQGRETMVETAYETTESFYDNNGLLSRTVRTGYGGWETHTNRTYDVDGNLVQESVMQYGDGEWWSMGTTNHTYENGLLMSSETDGGSIWMFTYNGDGDLITSTYDWGMNMSTTVTNHWGYVNPV